MDSDLVVFIFLDLENCSDLLLFFLIANLLFIDP